MSDKPSWKDRLKKAYDAASKKGREIFDEGRKNAGPLLEEGRKKAGELYEDAKKNAGETLDTLSVLTDGKKDGAEPKKDRTLRERFDAAREKVKGTDWNAVVKDTAREITKKDELKKLAGSVIILPGGLAVYGAYRVAKHHKEKEAQAEQERLKKATAAADESKATSAANENKAAPARKPRKPRPPRKPAA